MLLGSFPGFRALSGAVKKELYLFFLNLIRHGIVREVGTGRVYSIARYLSLFFLSLSPSLYLIVSYIVLVLYL